MTASSNTACNALLNILLEARRADLPYTEKKSKGAIDKVIVSLDGSQSTKFTKLAKKFKELKEATEELSAKTNALNAEIKDEALDLFDASDEVYTRIIETVSMTLNISKRQPDSIEKSEKINYEKIITDITALVPELTEKIAEIIKANTTVEEKTKVAKSPALRVDLKEASNFKEIIAFAKRTFKSMLSAIKFWGKTYDKKLADIEKRFSQI
jgi:hypothetical protein